VLVKSKDRSARVQKVCLNARIERCQRPTATDTTSAKRKFLFWWHFSGPPEIVQLPSLHQTQSDPILLTHFNSSNTSVTKYYKHTSGRSDMPAENVTCVFWGKNFHTKKNCKKYYRIDIDTRQLLTAIHSGLLFTIALLNTQTKHATCKLRDSNWLVVI